MRRLLALALIPLLVAGELWGEEQTFVPGALKVSIGLLECNVEDMEGLVINVDVYHTSTGVNGVRFRAGLMEGGVATYLGETIHFQNAVGNTQDGILVCYGSCMEGPIHVATIQYLLLGESAVCGDIRALPFPGADGPEALGCGGEIGLTTTSRLVFAGPHDSCGLCSAELTYSGTPAEGLSCLTVPVEATTWGAIKSMYR